MPQIHWKGSLAAPGNRDAAPGHDQHKSCKQGERDENAPPTDHSGDCDSSRYAENKRPADAHEDEADGSAAHYDRDQFRSNRCRDQANIRNIAANPNGGGSWAINRRGHPPCAASAIGPAEASRHCALAGIRLRSQHLDRGVLARTVDPRSRLPRLQSWSNTRSRQSGRLSEFPRRSRKPVVPPQSSCRGLIKRRWDLLLAAAVHWSCSFGRRRSFGLSWRSDEWHHLIAPVAAAVVKA